MIRGVWGVVFAGSGVGGQAVVVPEWGYTFYKYTFYRLMAVRALRAFYGTLNSSIICSNNCFDGYYK